MEQRLICLVVVFFDQGWQVLGRWLVIERALPCATPQPELSPAPLGPPALRLTQPERPSSLELTSADSSLSSLPSSANRSSSSLASRSSSAVQSSSSGWSPSQESGGRTCQPPSQPTSIRRVAGGTRLACRGPYIFVLPHSFFMMRPCSASESSTLGAAVFVTSLCRLLLTSTETPTQPRTHTPKLGKLNCSGKSVARRVTYLPPMACFGRSSSPAPVQRGGGQVSHWLGPASPAAYKDSARLTLRSACFPLRAGGPSFLGGI